MTRSGVFLSIFILMGSIGFSTASRAEGFLEMLFGGGRQHSESHANYVLTPPMVHRHVTHRHYAATHHKKAHHLAMRAHSRHHHAFARHKAAPVALAYAAAPASPVDERKCCGDAQDAIAKVMHDDPTLRPGDAYMSADGLRVYEGDRANDQEFVPVGKARALDKNSKARLAAIEKAPVFDRTSGRGLKPRLAAVPAPHAGPGADQKSTKLNNERLIKTFNGKTIRFVGGYTS